MNGELLVSTVSLLYYTVSWHSEFNRRELISNRKRANRISEQIFQTMSVLSKYFQDAMASATCKDIIHPHTDSCIQAAYGYFLKPVLTTMQFFLPLFMVCFRL